MDGLSAAALLDLYDAGARATPLRQAVLLLRAARPELGEAAEDVPIGDRDRAVWALRRATFGGAAESLATCSVCGFAIEVALPAEFEWPARASESASVRHGDRDYPLRLPTSRDLGEPGGAGFPLGNLAADAPWDDEAFVEKAAAALEEADPGMEVRIEMECPGCGAAVTEIFDAARYFWDELAAEARRTIGEVARLARAFGWAERDILAMTPARRAAYLAEAEA